MLSGSTFTTGGPVASARRLGMAVCNRQPTCEPFPFLQQMWFYHLVCNHLIIVRSHYVQQADALYHLHLRSIRHLLRLGDEHRVNV